VPSPVLTFPDPEPGDYPATPIADQGPDADAPGADPWVTMPLPRLDGGMSGGAGTDAGFGLPSLPGNGSDGLRVPGSTGEGVPGLGGIPGATGEGVPGIGGIPGAQGDGVPGLGGIPGASGEGVPGIGGIPGTGEASNGLTLPGTGGSQGGMIEPGGQGFGLPGHGLGQAGHGFGLPGTNGFVAPGSNPFTLPGASPVAQPEAGAPGAPGAGDPFDGIGNGDNLGVFLGTELSVDFGIGPDGIYLNTAMKVDFGVGNVGDELDQYTDWLADGMRVPDGSRSGVGTDE